VNISGLFRRTAAWVSGLSRASVIALAAGGVVVVVGGAVLAFEPVTYNLIAQDGLCLYCHEPFDATLEKGPRHPEDPEEGAVATCVECHAVPGLMGTVFTYTHLASVTDFYGGYRSAYDGRARGWVAPIARRAYRVRDGLRATRASSCEWCHTLDNPVPKKKRGKRSHKQAEEKNLTCINCHYNLIHREVDPRADFVR
jgi:nitrate/TMAO reductase-like tetraheme cytochrome c subunit